MLPRQIALVVSVGNLVLSREQSFFLPPPPPPPQRHSVVRTQIMYCHSESSSLYIRAAYNYNLHYLFYGYIYEYNSLIMTVFAIFA
jgi:hypothetical protein